MLLQSREITFSAWLSVSAPQEFEEAIEFSDAASISSVTKLNIATIA
jgi:hypothetical protein